MPWRAEDAPGSLAQRLAADGTLLGLDRLDCLVVPSPAAAALTRVTYQLLRGGGSVLLVGAADWVVRGVGAAAAAALPARAACVHARTALSRSTTPAQLASLVKEQLYSRRQHPHPVVRGRAGQTTVLHVDDLHVPMMHGAASRPCNAAQPAVVEWLRQAVDGGGFFDTAAGAGVAGAGIGGQACALPQVQLLLTGRAEYTAHGGDCVRLCDRLRRHLCVLAMGGSVVTTPTPTLTLP